MRILGIDPGLQKTGWGIIEKEGHALRFVGCGLVKTDPKAELAYRLSEIYAGLDQVIIHWQPEHAAIEETFVNKNPHSTLKLGQARGVALLVPALHGLQIGEYPANLIKKTVVGSGHAAKQQMGMMIKTLLPAIPKSISEDEADALAISICHAHHSTKPYLQRAVR